MCVGGALCNEWHGHVCMGTGPESEACVGVVADVCVGGGGRLVCVCARATYISVHQAQLVHVRH